ncbi:sex pilus assembly protein TraH [Burkholderia gladioli]|uniref:Sex pilus assembly protein TraH n=1 Tax=Burkholderia gladioli TaxID=28095 RepID=A0A2A7SB41_BURGA|nr:conjugal transfer protein TraH [Burkholderia gladioli]PEH40505.1 sex pilus assembly protein TraH [Burkholderia gladioli]
MPIPLLRRNRTRHVQRNVFERNWKPRLRRLAGCLGVALIILQAGAQPALASVSSDMDAMWNTTAARAYTTNTSTGIYGGSFALRAPIAVAQIVSFDPPHFDAGCGGIDMFLGSFSFLSAQELSDLIRAIIQSAAGYLVHLAIKAICDPCESIMSKLEKIMQELNAGQINTCHVAKAMVDTTLKGAGVTDLLGKNDPATAEIDANALSVSGTVGDWFSGLTQIFNQGVNSVTQQAQSVAPSTATGNIVVNSIMTTNALDQFSATGIFGGQQGTTEMILSLFGTSLLQTTQSAGTTAGGANTSLPAENFDNRLTFQDLIDGPSNTPKPIYRCTDWQDDSPITCQTIDRSQNYTALNFPGTQRYTVQTLAGDQSSSGLLGVDPNADRQITVIQQGSILANMQAGVPLNQQQLAFLKAFPVGYQTLLLDAYSASPTMSLYNEIAQLMSEDLAVSLAEGLERIVTVAFIPGSQTNQAGGKTVAPIPPNVETAREQFERDMAKYEGQTSNDRLQRLQSIVTALNIEARMTGSPIMGGGK